MKKMPTLFERQFENHEITKCLEQVHEGCEWVLNDECYVTEKLDGTCCMIYNIHSVELKFCVKLILYM